MATIIPEYVRNHRLRRDVKLPSETNERIEALMRATGINAKTEMVKWLLDELAKIHPEIAETQVATWENVLSDPAPVCIFGKPGSGKSYTMKNLVLEARAAG